MRSLPKPLIGLLLGTVAFFAVWMVALKPSSSSSGGSPSGVGQYQSAINKAHQAVTTSNQANARLGAPTSTTSAPAAKTATTQATTTPATTTPATKTPATTTPATKTTASTATASKAASKTAAAAKTPASTTVSPATEVQTVDSAVRAGKVVAILFYNDAAADDRAMKSELAAIPTHKGQVVKLAVPLSQLTQFSAVTTQVPVNTSPTLVLIDPARQATALIGYADGVEIAQRIDDALAVTPTTK